MLLLSLSQELDLGDQGPMEHIDIKLETLMPRVSHLLVTLAVRVTVSSVILMEMAIIVMEMVVMTMEMAVMVMEMDGSHDDGDGSHDVFLLCGWITLAIRMTVLSVMMLEVAICQSCWWRWQSVNHADGGGSHVNVVVFRCGWSARLQTVQTADLPCFLC